MTKWFLLVYTACFLLCSGCGAWKSEAVRGLDDKNKTDIPELHANPKLTPPSSPSITYARPAYPLITVDAPTHTPSPSPQPFPAPKPSQQASRAQSTPATKSKTPKNDGVRKPSVPAHKSQGQARAARKNLSLSQLANKYPDILMLKGSAKEKKAALTFDDGPDSQFTSKVLDALQVAHVKATFFLIGTKASAHPELVRRIVREGHVVGNHSYSHANFPKLPPEQFHEQIESAELILRQLTGYAPKLVRPPYGAINEQQLKWFADHHYLIVNWNVDSLDWKQLSSDQVLSTILQQTRPGSIILQHSGGGDKQDLSGTVLALPELIRRLQADGYQLVTVPELLHVPKSR